MEIRIEPTTDPLVVASLNQGVQSLHAERYPEYFKPYDREAVLEHCQKQLKEPLWFCDLALADSVPAGYVLYFLRNYGENPFRYAYKGVHIDQICVAQEYRGKGLGRALMAKVESKARELGASQLELTYWDKNHEAGTFYTGEGFSPGFSFVVRRL